MKKLITVLVLMVLFTTLTGVSINAQDQLMIRIEGENYLAEEIEQIKELLFIERIEIAFLMNEEKFAEGLVGLSEDGIAFIWVPHKVNNHRARYVRAYNEIRRSIYGLEF